MQTIVEACPAAARAGTRIELLNGMASDGDVRGRWEGMRSPCLPRRKQAERPDVQRRLSEHAAQSVPLQLEPDLACALEGLRY